MVTNLLPHSSCGVPPGMKCWPRIEENPSMLIGLPPRRCRLGAYRFHPTNRTIWRRDGPSLSNGASLEVDMLRLSTAVRLFAIALVGIFTLSAASDAQTPPAPARISIEIISGGFIVGGTGGSGTLSYDGKRYALNIGGLKA